MINPNVNAGTGSGVGALVASLAIGSIFGCYVEGGSVSGESSIGGLIGGGAGIVANCYTTCSVSGNGINGIIGGLMGSTSGTVIGSYAMGDVLGGSIAYNVGGLIGLTWGAATITDCYATGNIYGDALVGGLIGSFQGGGGSTITNCYAVGSVSASWGGGLIGDEMEGGTVTNCFWDVDTSGKPEPGLGTGLSTAAMMTESTFTDAGWDFDSVWVMCGYGGNYPRLAWEGPRVYYVDAAGGDDNNNGLSPTMAFATVQAGVDAAYGCETVYVKPGVYAEDININGYPIRLRSIDPADPNIVNDTVIAGYVQFDGTENEGCELSGFKIDIQDSYNGAINGACGDAVISYCVISSNDLCGAPVIMDCNGTINNCLIVDNSDSGGCGPPAPVVFGFGCSGLIKNCTIANNTSGVSNWSGDVMTLQNCIIYNNTDSQLSVYGEGSVNVSYCNLQGGTEGITGDGTVNLGLGNIDTDPCFVDTAGGNYHLKSNGWRWLESLSQWVYDDVTSRCIDAGNPGSPLGDEPLAVPRDLNNEDGINLRVNMGFYGGTSYASMAPHDWAILGDLNNDGTVAQEDLAGQAQDWLIGASAQPGDLNRDGMVNIRDFAALAADWMRLTDWAQ